MVGIYNLKNHWAFLLSHTSVSDLVPVGTDGKNMNYEGGIKLS